MKSSLILITISFVQWTACISQQPSDEGMKNFTWTYGTSPSNDYRYNLAISVLDKIYVVGGDNNGAFEVYDPQKDSWNDLPPMPTPRLFACGAAVDSTLFIIGGMDDSLNYASTVEKFEIRTKQWSTCKELPTSSSRMAAVTYQGKVYVFGGLAGSSDKDFKNVKTVFMYDPSLDKWIQKSDMPTPRHGHSAAVVKDRILVVGGYLLDNIGVVEAYDPIQDSWSTKAPLPTPRGFMGLAALDDYVYAICGRIWAEEGPVERYDIEKDQWVQLIPVPARRQRFGITNWQDKVYIIGGEHSPKSVLIGEFE